ncbi:hypothetical protein EI555_000892 [Monodon monoceros]|uniref:Uncharacterized protein n=1 Tax=Monodon monoceros TaxID=40151 RepID=A0A4U1EJE6_MONMO|nr:hypothetical protein EI555_000892 [Monodon monoceros]
MKKIKAHNIPQEVLTRYRNRLWSQSSRILGPSGLKPWHLHSHLVTYVRTPLRAQTLRPSRTVGLHNHVETKLPSTAITTGSNTLDKNFTVRWKQHFENFHDISRDDIFFYCQTCCISFTAGGDQRSQLIRRCGVSCSLGTCSEDVTIRVAMATTNVKQSIVPNPCICKNQWAFLGLGSGFGGAGLADNLADLLCGSSFNLVARATPGLAKAARHCIPVSSAYILPPSPP